MHGGGGNCHRLAPRSPWISDPTVYPITVCPVVAAMALQERAAKAASTSADFIIVVGGPEIQSVMIEVLLKGPIRRRAPQDLPPPWACAPVRRACPAQCAGRHRGHRFVFHFVRCVACLDVNYNPKMQAWCSIGLLKCGGGAAQTAAAAATACMHIPGRRAQRAHKGSSRLTLRHVPLDVDRWLMQP